jgi:hypothetical protein
LVFLCSRSMYLWATMKELPGKQDKHTHTHTHTHNVSKLKCSTLTGRGGSHADKHWNYNIGHCISQSHWTLSSLAVQGKPCRMKTDTSL